jgi:hypothetical protein
MAINGMTYLYAAPNPSDWITKETDPEFFPDTATKMNTLINTYMMTVPSDLESLQKTLEQMKLTYTISFLKDGGKELVLRSLKFIFDKSGKLIDLQTA